uniref:Uncharacterized protein n=1 Tax=Anguilla anguilla TaxID=7936 RepID=A0A0E9QFI9_ANGAN
MPCAMILLLISTKHFKQSHYKLEHIYLKTRMTNHIPYIPYALTYR